MTTGTPQMRFDDETLIRFLDGHLSDAEAQAVAQVAAEDADLAARLQALTLDMSQLAAGFDALLDQAPAMEPPVPAPDNVVPLRRLRPTLVQLAIAACVALVVGFGLGRGTAPDPAQPGWIDAVAGYQNLYSADSFRWGPPEPREANADIKRVAGDLGLELSLSDLQSDGLEFRLAQVLSFRDKPLAQFMFRDADGNPVAFCILRNGAADHGLQTRQVAGLAAVTWQKDGLGFVVIGKSDAALLQSVSERLSQAI